VKFESSKYGPEIARILALEGDGQRLMPLTCQRGANDEARLRLKTLRPRDLFPGIEPPEPAMAGLWLYFSCFDEAHALADSCPTQDGEYWHAIVHRQEPDAWNSGYWFRRVGRHAIFPELARAAAEISGEFQTGGWDPFAFIDFCQQARTQPGSARERSALDIQRAEWQLLFDHCVAPVSVRQSR